ncbi:molybdenum cofactor biosynthesis protein MoaE [Arenimonas sp.]|uniref:molybdenum cofactor biosynthesis protein MoaE n=1 Tax=Arenimonas sp. TaxID=1872635 RepID=UPI0039E37363
MEAHRFLLVDRAVSPLDPAAAQEFVADPAFGGIALFVGRVRDHNQGRAVTGISYDAYAPLVLARFAEIAAQAESQFGPRLKLYIAHAHGRLVIGDLAVIVAAGSPHRDEAFRACRLAIEAVKHSTPIWKQEHYVEGDSAWSDGSALHEGDAPTGAGA